MPANKAKFSFKSLPAQLVGVVWQAIKGHKGNGFKG